MDFGTVGTNTQWTDTTGRCTTAASPSSCVNVFANERRVTDNSVLIGFNYVFATPVAAAVPFYTK